MFRNSKATEIEMLVTTSLYFSLCGKKELEWTRPVQPAVGDPASAGGLD